LRAIFLSYRRNDAEGEAGRLFDDLISDFGTDKVFMDVAGIEPGRDFRKVIDQNVSTCGVLLAMIGRSWIDATDEGGRRRLDDPLDFVRLETASALKRDIPVIPVLVQRGRMPRPEELPEDLKDLAYRNAVELTHARWDSDVQLLIKALRPYVGKALEEGGSTKTETAPRPELSGKGSAPASEKEQLLSTITAPMPLLRRYRLGIVVAAVAIALGVGGFGTYEYKKAEEARVRRAVAEDEARRLAEKQKAPAGPAATEKIGTERQAAEKSPARITAPERAPTETPFVGGGKKPGTGQKMPDYPGVIVASTRSTNSNRPSPPATARCSFATGRSIDLAYSSPQMNGRKIFGGLLPYGQVFRAGANEATSLVTTADLLLGGKDLPAGNYTIFVIPNSDKWTLIISRKTGEWGIPYPEGYDLLRVDMSVSQLPSQVENFTISFDPAGRNCDMRIDWENTRASAEFAEKQ